MKICLYQGTFNPPHLGHLQVAKFACDALHFDRVLFIPAAKPPHKALAETKEQALHRLRMTELLVKDYPQFEVSDIEFQRETPSYTLVTIQELYKQGVLTEKPAFIIGDDAFAKIDTWYHADEFKELIDFVVLPRGNDFDKEVFDRLAEKGYNYTRLDMPKINISSTEIRDLAGFHKSLENLTTKEVEKYIYDNNLYKNDNRCNFAKPQKRP
ncbi:MAG: nicotinate (nicotinamide) nucleotide adenylyltransferase [Candidatus Gastranaerophilales bacterium]|nr:nicotinate (nicotinamide) nucleotide adenylyltransferase [Candidatus Gastranaerophilales bacterium]